MIDSHTLRRVLYGSGDERLRATWRVAAGVAAFAVAFVSVGLVVSRLPQPGLLRNAPSILPAVAGTVAVTLVAKRVEDRSVAEQGFSFDRSWWRDLLAGVGLGGVGMGVTIGLWMETGAVSVVETLSTGVLSAPLAAVAMVTAAIGFLGIGLWEEVVFRGLLVRNGVDGFVARGFSRRTAAVGAFLLGVVVFGVTHALVPAQGATATFAAVQGVLAVVYYTTAYVLTEHLALPIGLHFSMNFTNAALFPTGSSVPALVRVEQTLTIEPSVLIVPVVSTVLLTLGIVGWVSFTRGTVSVADCFATPSQESPRSPLQGSDD